MRFKRLDGLKGLCIIAVVILHTNPLEVKSSDILTYGFLYLAVPLFYLTSIYLLFIKLSVDRLYIFRGRLLRLLAIYLFWAGVFLWLGNRLTVETYVFGVVFNYHNPYWFVLDLAILNVVGYLAYSLSEKILRFMIVLTLVCLMVLEVAAIAPGRYALVDFTNFFNFVPYVFAAALIQRFNFNFRSKIFFGMFVMAAEFLLLQYPLDYKYLLPPYTRIGLCLTAVGLFDYILHLRWDAWPAWLTTVGRYSLWVFILQSFLELR